MSTNERRIYVACLASYNSGVLHGRWIDASEDVDAMQEEVNAMLRASPYPNVRVDCPDCMGTGESFPGVRCGTCKATGSVPSAEEWAIHDHEGLGDLGEYAGLHEVARRMKVAEVAEVWGIEPETLTEAMEAVADPGDDPEDFMAERFHGVWSSWEDMDESFWEDTGLLDEVPESLVNYIDWTKVARDMGHGGDFYAVDTPEGIAFFRAY